MLPRNKLLTISNKNESVYIRAEEIAYVRADGNYSDIYMKDGSCFKAMLVQIGELARRMSMLDPQVSRLFVLVGRSVIVNTDLIVRIAPSRQVLTLDIVSTGGCKTELNPSVKALQVLRQGMDLGEVEARYMAPMEPVPGQGFSAYMEGKKGAGRFNISDDEVLFLG